MDCIVDINFFVLLFLVFTCLQVLAANMDQNGDSLSREMKRVFDDCTVMFWNSSVRAFEAYSSNNYDQALEIWGGALMYIK